MKNDVYGISASILFIHKKMLRNKSLFILSDHLFDHIVRFFFYDLSCRIGFEPIDGPFDSLVEGNRRREPRDEPLDLRIVKDDARRFIADQAASQTFVK